METCKACNGTGEVDTGGSTPWGAWITDACPYCDGTGKEKPDAEDSQ